MACTLDLYTDYLLSSTGQTSATGLSRLFDGQISHDQVTRWLKQVYLDSRQVWSHAKPLIRRAEQAHEPPVLDGKRDVVDDRERSVTLRQTAQLEHRFSRLCHGRGLRAKNGSPIVHDVAA